METFEIEYEGQNLTVEVTPVKKDKENGNIYQYKVVLPERTNDKGATFCQVITGYPVKEENRYVGMEWKHTTFVKGFPQIYAHTWLKANGHMAYSSFKQQKPIESPERFNPESKEKGNVFLISKRIFEVAKKIIDSEMKGKIPDDNLGMAPYEILELRKDVLNTTLSLLGKSDEKEPSFFVLGKIGKRLKEYQNLGAYVRRTIDSKGRESFELRISEGFNKAEFAKKVEIVRKNLAEDKAFIEAQKEQLENQRTFLADFGEDGYTDYCIDISKSSTVLPEEATLYEKVVSDITDLYRSLNADLIPYSQSSKVSNSVSLDGEDLDEKISEIIASRDFERACDIEDRFVIGEAERFAAYIDKTVNENPRTVVSSLAGTLVALKRSALTTRERKQKYMSRYEEMLDSFSSSTKQINKPLEKGEVPHE